MKPTREKVLNEPAGIQMDTWVAEYVMGWHKGVYFYGEEAWLDADGNFICVISTGEYEDDEDFHLTKWHPSESILWAWQVEERIHELGLVDYYVQDLYDIANLAWDNSVRLPQHWQLIHAQPVERCRAALLSVLER